ncbi:hypothetical protein ANCDUO_12392 [Ancylostoma duodenale]|uniref:Cytosolic fatty-acid binding proteins domain-containing protein n=1 Tax=Ancylostoma duodenale TaxID=51022 RepID=A0A0C2GK29_9BILA|nr:hypothetical protein ANCDUO_12392 [Ancylostoma duodenale]
MRRFALILTLCSAVSLQMDQNVIPDKFFGRFTLERSENFDEFLAAKGRYCGTTSRYNMENLTSKKNTLYHGWKLGETFEADGLDGNRHNVTFTFADDTLMEKHVRLNDPNDKGETYYFNIDNDDKLVLVCCLSVTRKQKRSH